MSDNAKKLVYLLDNGISTESTAELLRRNGYETIVETRQFSNYSPNSAAKTTGFNLRALTDDIYDKKPDVIICPDTFMDDANTRWGRKIIRHLRKMTIDTPAILTYTLQEQKPSVLPANTEALIDTVKDRTNQLLEKLSRMIPEPALSK